MILLFSSAGQEIFKQFVLRVLCYPARYLLNDVPYSLGRVEERFVHRPADLRGKDGAIVFADYVDAGGRLEPCYLPVRRVRIESSRIFAGKLLLNLRLGDYVHYSDAIRQSYRERVVLNASRLWSQVIGQQRNAPRPIARADVQIDPRDPGTWHSGGKFVIEIPDDALDLRPEREQEAEIRERADDWKSTVDMLAQRTQLQDKLFYQILGLARTGDERLTLADRTGQSTYELRPGDSVDLVLHFYYGDAKKRGPKRILEIGAESAYFALIGRTEIEVYPEQISGKIERLAVVVKKQLSEEYARLSLREKNGQIPVLAQAELCLRIQPRRLFIWSILLLFSVGSLLNAVPGDLASTWYLKAVGSGCMTVAFWLAFSKFPSK